MMEAFGAHITDVISDQGKITESLIKAMIRKAAEIGASPGHWYCDQLNNTYAINGYRPLGEEIWAQTAGRVDAFVHAVGTANAIHCATRALWAHRPEIRIVAVEPQESAVLSGKPSGARQIEGIGIGFVPPPWEPELVNEIQTVTTSDAKAMARRLATEEGIFAGTSSGANVMASIRIAQRLGPGATVVTIICDSGLRYLSTDVYLRQETAPNNARRRLLSRPPLVRWASVISRGQPCASDRRCALGAKCLTRGFDGASCHGSESRWLSLEAISR